jgi:hypothetical protein
MGLQIGVARGQHRGETRGFHLTAFALARLFEMPMIADFFQRAFAVDFLFQPAQRLVHGLAFFKSDFGQLVLTSSPVRLGKSQRSSLVSCLNAARESSRNRSRVNGQKPDRSVPEEALRKAAERQRLSFDD